MARYGPLADAGQAEALAALWTADGTYGIIDFATPQGHAEMPALMASEEHRRLMAGGCAHVLITVAVTLAGDAATAVNHSVAFRHDHSEFTIHRASANRWRLERTAAGWRVVHSANATLDGGEAACLLLIPPAGPRRW